MPKKNFIILKDSYKSRLDLNRVASYYLIFSKVRNYNHHLYIIFNKNVKDRCDYFYSFEEIESAKSDLRRLDEFCIGKTEEEEKILP